MAPVRRATPSRPCASRSATVGGGSQHLPGRDRRTNREKRGRTDTLSHCAPHGRDAARDTYDVSHCHALHGTLGGSAPMVVIGSCGDAPGALDERISPPTT